MAKDASKIASAFDYPVFEEYDVNGVFTPLAEMVNYLNAELIALYEVTKLTDLNDPVEDAGLFVNDLASQLRDFTKELKKKIEAAKANK